MAKKVKLAALPCRMTVQAYGVTLELRAESKAALRKFAKAWPYGCAEVESGEPNRVYAVIAADAGGWKLYANSRKLAEYALAEDLRQRLRSNAQLFIAANSSQFVFIHAGVIAFDDGAILIPGRSYSGKTTLVKAFVEAGATYYSDEYAILDEQGMVHPYPRPLSVRGGKFGKQRDVPASKLGAKIGTKPIPVKMILLTKYQPGTQWEPKIVSAGEASKGLAFNAVAIRRFPAQALRAIAKVANIALGCISIRGDANVLVEHLCSFSDVSVGFTVETMT